MTKTEKFAAIDKVQADAIAGLITPEAMMKSMNEIAHAFAQGGNGGVIPRIVDALSIEGLRELLKGIVGIDIPDYIDKKTGLKMLDKTGKPAEYGTNVKFLGGIAGFMGKSKGEFPLQYAKEHETKTDIAKFLANVKTQRDWALKLVGVLDEVYSRIDQLDTKEKQDQYFNEQLKA